MDKNVEFYHGSYDYRVKPSGEIYYYNDYDGWQRSGYRTIERARTKTKSADTYDASQAKKFLASYEKARYRHPSEVF